MTSKQHRLHQAPALRSVLLPRKVCTSHKQVLDHACGGSVSAQLEKVVLHEEVKKAVHDEVTLTTYVRTCPWSSDGLECLQNGELAAGHVQLKGTETEVVFVVTERARCGVGEEALVKVALGHRRLCPLALHTAEEHAFRVSHLSIVLCTQARMHVLVCHHVNGSSPQWRLAIRVAFIRPCASYMKTNNAINTYVSSLVLFKLPVLGRTAR